MDRSAGRLAGIATVLSLAVAGCGGDGGGVSGRAGAAVDAKARKDCDGPPARTAKALVASLPRGWKGKPADQEVIDTATTPDLHTVVDRLTARAVTLGGEPAGVVLVYEFKASSALEGFMSGFEEEANGKAEEIRFAGGRGTMYRMKNGVTSVAGVSGPCTVTAVFGSTADVARELVTEFELEPS